MPVDRHRLQVAVEVAAAVIGSNDDEGGEVVVVVHCENQTGLFSLREW